MDGEAKGNAIFFSAVYFLLVSYLPTVDFSAVNVSRNHKNRLASKIF